MILNLARSLSRRAVALVGLVFFVALSAAGSAKAQTPIDPEAIDDLVREALDRDRIPGATVVIVDKDKVLFLRAFGLDGRGNPVTVNTAFRLGSMSKAFTALVAMRLIERGILALDTPITTLLPDLAPFNGSGATLEHLLRHTSGLPSRTPQAGLNASLADYVAALDAVDLVATSGETHIYSSANYLVAARALEKATGARFEDLLLSEILEPLGISPVHASPDGTSPAIGHRFWGIWPRAYQPFSETGRLATASVTASAQDMARFLQFQLGDGTWEGTPLLSKASLDILLTGTADGDGFRYALGWRDGLLRGTRAVWHGGVLPEHQGMMILLPEHGLGVAVLLNASSILPLPARPTSHRLAVDISEMVLGETPLSARISFSTWLLGLWLALGAILLHQLYTVFRVMMRRDPARHPLRASVTDAAIMLALIIGLPVYLNLPWSQFARQMPDLTVWIVVMCILTTITALIRAVQKRSRNG